MMTPASITALWHDLVFEGAIYVKVERLNVYRAALRNVPLIETLTPDGRHVRLEIDVSRNQKSTRRE